MTKFVFLFCLMFGASAWASLEIGVGTTSVTSGRASPALSGALTGSNWAIVGFSTGVRSAYYYQSSYQLGYLRTWKAGDMFGGTVNAGFGAATVMSVREFQDDGATTDPEKAGDALFGPIVRANLSWGWMYIDVTATYGIRNFGRLIQLSSQDVVCFSLGAALW